MVSPRIPFMQIRSLGVDRQSGLKGNVVNVPIEVSSAVSVLPRSFSDVQTVQLKLVRKMVHKGPYIFETVRPQMVYDAAKLLVRKPLYVEHNVATLASHWLEEHSAEKEAFVADRDDLQFVEENTGPEQMLPSAGDAPQAMEDDGLANSLALDVTMTAGNLAPDDKDKSESGDDRAHRQANAEDDDWDDDWDETLHDEPVNAGTEETLLESGEAIKFAPGEGQRPLSVLLDRDCEELSFPTIYCGHRRDVPSNVSYTDIAKSEARRYDRRAVKVQKLFFSYKKMEMLRLASSIQTCLRKKTQDKEYTAGAILEQGTVEGIVNDDAAYHVLRPVRGSPPFWEQKKKNLLAMVRQLGCPTFFFTLSAAETKWKHLLNTLAKVSTGEEMDEESMNELNFLAKSQMIRDDPITCARYFDHRFRALFNNVIMSKDGNGPLGEVIDFFTRVEFQHRGSPHVHGLLWVKSAPAYDPEKPDSVREVTSFVDKHITCHIPQELEPLHEQVKYQQHKHSHTCLKQSGKEKTCRFNIPKFPMTETRVLTPLALDEVSQCRKEQLQDVAKTALAVLKNLQKDQALDFDGFLQKVGCSHEEYVLAIRSTLKREQLMLRRRVEERRSNAYNPEILSLWEANMDIQFVLDPYACVMYIINYVGKSQRGISALLRQVIADAKKGNTSHREKLRAVANSFLNCSEISAQETCYYLLGMPVNTASRACVFINTSRPEKRVRMLKAEDVLKAMNPESTDVMCTGFLEKYIARPDSMENTTLAELASDYAISNKDLGQDQPHDEDEDEDEDDGQGRRKKKREQIKLKNGMGVITKRGWSRVIRYCNFNKVKDETEFYREQLMLFHHWRNEQRDLIDIDHKSEYELHEDTISEIRSRYVSACESAVRMALDQEGDEDADGEALEGVVPIADLDEEPLGPEQDGFEAMEDEQGRRADIMDEVGKPAVPPDAERFLAPGRIPDKDFEELLSSLNKTQAKYLMHCVHSFKTGRLPLYEFVSGGAGVGKSRLIKVLYQALIRYFGKIPGAHPDDLFVLLCAPTGKAAFNIGGMTLHSALSLPLNQYGGMLPSLGSDISNTLASKLHSVKLIIIDEISMVGAKMLNGISARLGHIFKSKEPFGGVSILAVGDLNQLPPVGDSFPFTTPRGKDDYAQIVGPVLWESFRLLELSEIMRQKDDLLFAKALGNLVAGKLDNAQKALLMSRRVCPRDIPEDVIHLFHTNQEVNDFNEEALRKMDTEGATSIAEDVCQGDATDSVKESFREYVSGLKTSETYGLPYNLTFKTDGRYMMTNNVETADGLVNGATGRLRHIQCARSAPGTDRKPVRVWIEFDDPSVGSSMRGNNRRAAQSLGLPTSWTPVDPVCRLAKRKQGGGNLQIMRKQFPLVPAMAITVHKSQGDTYSRVAVHLTRGMKRASLYVACSRAKTAEGLYLVGDLHLPGEPGPRDKVTLEMARLRRDSPIVPSIKFLDEHSGPDLKIAFHNVQSLQSHHATSCADASLMSVDVLCFVETKTRTKGSVHFPGFDCVFERICFPYYGTSVYVKAGIRSSVANDILETERGHIEFTTVSVERANERTHVSVVYKKPNTVKCVLEQTLAKAIGRIPAEERHVCVGDFNIDRRKPAGDSLIEFMRNRSLRPLLLPDCPTTNQGTQIDQCFSNIDTAYAGTGESMTSYHKPLWVIVPSPASLT